LYTEASTEIASVCPGDSVTIDIEVTQRLGEGIMFESYTIKPLNKTQTITTSLTTNESLMKNYRLGVPLDYNYTTPYWLKEKGTLGMYKVDDELNIGNPESDPAFTTSFNFMYLGYHFSVEKDIVYKFNSPEKGEVQQAFTVMPLATVNLKDDVVVFGTNAPKTVTVEVTAGKNNLKGKIKLCMNENWQVEPLSHDVAIDINGQSAQYTFKVTPPKGDSESPATPIFESEGESYVDKLVVIDYDHIPLQKILLPCEGRMVKIELQKNGEKIAYIMGAGDNIPASLRQIGYNVTEMSPEEIDLGKLLKYDAVVMGVRAYNKHQDIKYKQSDLMKYVENGGNLIVQYNTNRGLSTTEIGPYPLEISRNRVTVEEAPITIINEKHPLLNFPNKITSKDFDGWVQERGLYFVDKWDDKYETLISCNDPNEDPLQGGILATEYGKGRFVYTSMSWFRQLPAGVPGAFRLFTNLISWGLESTTQP
jgi:hypothetical protein